MALLLLLSAAFAPGAGRQQAAGAANVLSQAVYSSYADIAALRQRPNVRVAMRALELHFDQTVRETDEIVEIPAPSYKEGARAKYMLERFQHEPALRNQHIDDEGNVIAEYPGLNSGPTLVLSAHLDTVFPEGTDLKVRRNGTIHMAPGITDDSYPLAVLLAVVRAMQTAEIKTHGRIVFVADTGEEGLGNLRGTRYLFERSPYRKKIDMFLSIDGVDDSVVVNGAVASKRYRITFKGPGGHSYGAFGLVNPAYAMADAMERISKLHVPRRPKTTVNVGLVGGGTSVNSIPASTWMEVDMRSEAPQELAKLEQQMLLAVRLAVGDENRQRSTEQGSVTFDAKMVGERKGGQTSPKSAIVQAAIAVSQVTGKGVIFRASSTDSNVPISMGIPAITIGAGTHGGRSHSTGEWIDLNQNIALPGLERVLLLTLSLVGAE